MTKEQEDYERDLAEIQRQHLERIDNHFFTKIPWRPCMHDQCTQCHGTGVKWDGSACVHYISCPCPKCTPFC